MTRTSLNGMSPAAPQPPAEAVARERAAEQAWLERWVAEHQGNQRAAWEEAGWWAQHWLFEANRLERERRGAAPGGDGAAGTAARLHEVYKTHLLWHRRARLLRGTCTYADFPTPPTMRHPAPACPQTPEERDAATYVTRGGRS